MVGKGQLKAALGRATRNEVPECDYWRPELLQKLLTARLQAHYSADLEEEERITSLIDFLIVNFSFLLFLKFVQDMCAMCS